MNFFLHINRKFIFFFGIVTIVLFLIFVISKQFQLNNIEIELIENNIEDADIIHLATHGDPTSLVFASSSSNDGFLRDGEIYGLDLQANLVVLSACETGLGEITSDGIVGISRPFIAAGVPSVVMSLWLVPDAATSELMIDFHKNLQTGQNKAQALRQAMLSTMKTNPDPVNWAGFILVGESDPIQ